MAVSTKPKISRKRKAAGNNSPPALPDYLCPQLRLFLTADIVGSTNYKQSVARSFNSASPTTGEAKRKKNLHPKWFAPIADFYSQTQKKFGEEWEDIRKKIAQISVKTSAPLQVFGKLLAMKSAFPKDWIANFVFWPPCALGFLRLRTSGSCLRSIAQN